MLLQFGNQVFIRQQLVADAPVFLLLCRCGQNLYLRRECPLLGDSVVGVIDESLQSFDDSRCPSPFLAEKLGEFSETRVSSTGSLGRSDAFDGIRNLSVSGK